MPEPTVTVNTSGQPEVAKSYQRYTRHNPSNGKGSRPRNCFSQQFRNGWDRVFGRKGGQRHAA